MREDGDGCFGKLTADFPRQSQERLCGNIQCFLMLHEDRDLLLILSGEKIVVWLFAVVYCICAHTQTQIQTD